MNMWNEIDDFNHLKSTPSPNYSLLKPEQQISNETWRKIVEGGGESLEEILRSVGIVR